MRIRIKDFIIVSIGLVVLMQLTDARSIRPLRGETVDAETGARLSARLYISSSKGEWFHARSASPDGAAIEYSKVRGNGSVEVHTSLSDDPFFVFLEPGDYTLTAERGKEYLTTSVQVNVENNGSHPMPVVIPLQRWTDMAAKGWYSGETHVHRTVEELPTLMMAEDLNVAFPLTAWVTDSEAAPSKQNKNPDPVPRAELIEVDSTHVIWPINTEYEIFTVNGSRHTLGAVFILNHREALNLTAPPVKPIAEEARKQGGILELDKHNWPWSMMIVPVMKVGLYELTNNHIWRTQFQFKNWYPEYAGKYMDIEMVDGSFKERGWIDFGFKNYYALLNCGVDMKPTAGTASGVHPVPIGFGRVYVKIDGDFSYDKWMEGLTAGRSFVTTGPMLEVDIRRSNDEVEVSGVFESASKLGPIEILVNGDIAKVIKPTNRSKPAGGYSFSFNAKLGLKGSSWIAVRGFEDREDGRPRFAHSAPVHFEVSGKPLRPKREEVEYLAKRVEDELSRHQKVLSSEALNEYRAALDFYNGLLK